MFIFVIRTARDSVVSMKTPTDYFPKRTDLSVHSQGKLDYVARELNERPRKTLKFRASAEGFNTCVASTS